MFSTKQTQEEASKSKADIVISSEFSSDEASHVPSYFLNKETSDVTFVVQGREFPCHTKCLLLQSEVFYNMFSKEFEKVIEIEDTDEASFEEMLRYIYCGVLDTSLGKCHNIIINIFRLADRFQLLTLMRLLEVQLSQLITFDNVEIISEFTNFYRSRLLDECLDKFLWSNLKQLLLEFGKVQTNPAIGAPPEELLQKEFSDNNQNSFVNISHNDADAIGIL